MSEHFRTQYEKYYQSDEYYWGLEPASFLDELIQVTNKKASELAVLDIGCGEGKDAVYMAQRRGGFRFWRLNRAWKASAKASERSPPVFGRRTLAEHTEANWLYAVFLAERL